MPVAALITTMGLFMVALLAHLGWWRWRLPLRPFRALLLVFGLVPLVTVGLWLACGGPMLLVRCALPCTIVLYAGLTGCYLIAYAGVDQVSPSLLIIRALEAAGDAGCSREQLARLVTEDTFILPRLEALQRDGMLERVDGGSVLTPQGRRAARTAAALSSIFRIHETS
jgi:hypothetical protein